MVSIRGSRAATALGVNARFTIARSSSCRGGSMVIISGCTSGGSPSRVIPCADENVDQSCRVGSTSAKRLRAKNPFSGCRYRGDASRSQV